MTLASRPAVCYRPRCRRVALLPRGTAPRPVAQTVASPQRGDGRGVAWSL